MSQLNPNENENEKRHKDYGVYVTHDTYDGKWYAFNREAANHYWNGQPCKKSAGKTPRQALNNFHNENS